MLNQGRIIFDIKGEDKKKLTIEDLLHKFETEENIEVDDKLILCK